MDELSRLKYLLLNEEQDILKKFKEEINELKNNSNSSDFFISKISPLISSIINKGYTKDKELLVQALSPIVLELIDKNYNESQDKVVKQIAPLITTAIKEQIKSHKDEVVEALYPVIGNMITKYVTKTFEDMINTINSQIKNGLSFENISRKIKAKFHGISETELLLKQNALSNIRSVFLIHKQTGLVINHVAHEKTPIKEPEMIASMMTAIRSFVNDWIDKNDKYQELGTIEYGGNKIVLEVSGYSYLAVIVEGTVTKECQEKIRKTLEKLVNSFSDDFKYFDGDKEKLPNEKIYDVLSLLIDKKSIKENKRLHPIMYLFPLVFLSWLFYILYINSIDNSIKKQADEILFKTSDLTLYRLEVEVENKNLTVNGVVPYSFYKQLAYDKLKDIKDIKTISNNIQVITTSYNPKQLEDKIKYILIMLNEKESISLKTKFKYPYLELSGVVWSKKDLIYIKKIFSSLDDLKDISFQIDIKLPTISEIIYFERNSYEIPINQEYKLIKIINLLNHLDKNLIVEVKAYRDDTGSFDTNSILVENRAKEIESYFKLKGNVSQDIKAIGINDLPSNIEKDKYPQQGRRVTFSLKKRGEI